MNFAFPVQNTTVKLNLLHNISSLKCPEVRFDLHQSILSVKQSIEKRYGTNPSTMELILQDKEGNNICTMSDDNQPLGYYSPQDGYSIQVLDLNPHSVLKEIEDVSQIEKYVMSDETYDKLPDNFRKYKQKLMQHNPDLFDNKQLPAVVDTEYQKDLADLIQIGNRCKLIEQGHRGEVKYIGKIPYMGQGYFIGIKLDEPYGKNDGQYINVKYFECPDKYGIFVRPDEIEIGDFPELDIEDEIDEI